MLGAAAISSIQRKLGYSTSRADSILDELQIAQSRLEQGIPTTTGGFYLPWFLLSTVTDLSTVANQETLALPAGFLEENEDDDLFYFNPTAIAPAPQWTQLEKDDLDFLRDSSFTAGAPQKYALSGSNFYIFPTPDQIYTLKTSFYKSDAPITLVDENKWLKYASDILIGEAGIAMCISNRDKDAMTYFQALRTESISKLFAQTEARRHDNRRYAMGDKD